MKRTDIAMLIMIASVSVMIAFFAASNLPFLKIDEKGVEVDTFTAISSEVATPNDTVFPKDAINPTVQVFVKGGSSEIDTPTIEQDVTRGESN